MNRLFISDDSEIQKRLLRLENAIKSPCFLSGLVLGSVVNDLAKTFIITTDIIECCERLNSEEVYDLPEPWPYQCFLEILEEESGRIIYTALPKNKAIQIKKGVIGPNINSWNEIAFKFLDDKFKELNIEKTIKSLIKTPEELKLISWIYDSVFQSIIDAIVHLLIKAACVGDFSESPISERFLEILECGGIPSGWVGPRPVDGGQAKDCLQLFHLGD